MVQGGVWLAQLLVFHSASSGWPACFTFFGFGGYAACKCGLVFLPFGPQGSRVSASATRACFGKSYASLQVKVSCDVLPCGGGCGLGLRQGTSCRPRSAWLWWVCGAPVVCRACRRSGLSWLSPGGGWVSMALAGNVARSGRLPNNSVKPTAKPLRGSSAAYFKRYVPQEPFRKWGIKQPA